MSSSALYPRGNEDCSGSPSSGAGVILSFLVAGPLPCFTPKRMTTYNANAPSSAGTIANSDAMNPVSQGR